MDNAIALVRLAPDHGSIFVHVRGDSESSSDVRALMQRIVKVIQNKQVKFPGLYFNVEHCSYLDLFQNVVDPRTIPQATVVAAREGGLKRVYPSEGISELLSQLLAFDNNGMVGYENCKWIFFLAYTRMLFAIGRLTRYLLVLAVIFKF